MTVIFPTINHFKKNIESLEYQAGLASRQFMLSEKSKWYVPLWEVYTNPYGKIHQYNAWNNWACGYEDGATI